MKRKISILLILTMINGVVGCNFTSAATEETTIAYEVTGSESMVAAKEVLTNLGYDTNWESTSKTLYASKNKNVISITQDSDIAVLNGENIKMNKAAELLNGSLSVTSASLSKLTGEEINDDGTYYIEESSSDDSWKENKFDVDLSSVTDADYEITQEGIYTLTGDYSGMIHINCDGKVKLVLNNVTIKNDNGPAIYFENSAKGIIELAENSTNTLSDGSSYEDAKGCVFSNDDIDIQGNGTLNVNANYNHGIVSDDDIEIKESTINVTTSVGDGIKANGAVKIKSGNITLNTMGDGISGDECVVIDDGSVNITTNGDIPVSTGNDFGQGGFGGGKHQMMEGEANANTENGEQPQMPDGEQPQMPDGENGEMPQMGNRGFGGGRMQNGENGEMPQMQNGENGEMPQMQNGENGEMPQMRGGGFKDFGTESQNTENADSSNNNVEQRQPNDNMQQNNAEQSTETTEDESSVSSKGIKSDRNVTINGGEITINSTDHGIKCDDIIVINGGKINITSEISKGIKCLGNIFINDGNIIIDTKDEGIETKATLTVNGGNIDVTSDDDGINAGGGSGTMMMRDVQDAGEHQVVINGGDLTIDAKGDGIDSNGNLYLYGGNILVNGPTSNGDGAIDTAGANVYYGGTILAIGSSGMAECPEAADGKNVFNITLDEIQSAQSAILIMDSSNNTIYEAVSAKEFQSIVFASDDIETGKEYYVYINGEKAVTLTAESGVTRYGNQQNGNMGGMSRGNMGQMKEQNMGQMNEQNNANANNGEQVQN